MIGYSCKYAPLELIAAYGGKALMLDAETEDFSRAETLTHANVCCHAKALLTQALDISELVLTDCCDATRRTYDVLESEGRQRFLFQFDLPHDDAACARQRMTHELLRFAKAYGAYTGAAFSNAKFLAACRDNSHALLPNEPFIAVLGARVSPQLLGLHRHGAGATHHAVGSLPREPRPDRKALPDIGAKTHEQASLCGH